MLGLLKLRMHLSIWSLPWLHGPSLGHLTDKPFYLAVDASSFVFEVVYFRWSMMWNTRFATWVESSVRLKYAIRWGASFGDLRTRLQGVLRSASVVVSVDHSPLQFFNRVASSSQKLLRWILEQQQCALEIRHLPGRLNFIPDILCRPSELLCITHETIDFLPFFIVGTWQLNLKSTF